MALLMFIVGGCSAWPWPDSAASTTDRSVAAASNSRGGSVACPAAQARFLTCANGVKLVTYEAGLELPRFCEPLQQLEGKIRGFDRNQPLYPLQGGERAMLVGSAGWLLLPAQAAITDGPQSVAAWWNNRACTLPTALRP